MDMRLQQALYVAGQWKSGNASVGDCRKASVEAIQVAKEALNETAMAVARSIGHAVATAHMADHSLKAAWYALKAVICAGGSLEIERQWQDQQLPFDIRSLVLTARKSKDI